MFDLSNSFQNTKPKFLTSLSNTSSKGCISKAWYLINNSRYLVKGNSIELNGKFGYEPYSEVMAFKIAKLLGLDCVEYTLEPASNFKEVVCKDITHVSLCKNILESGEFIISYADSTRHLTDNTDYTIACDILGKRVMDEMLIFDALIGNCDRHSNNFGSIANKFGSKPLPVFDNGAALLSWCTADELDDPDFVQNYDKSLPFRYTHNEQIKLVDKSNISKILSNTTFDKIIEAITPELDLLDMSRADAVSFYLRCRWEWLTNA